MADLHRYHRVRLVEVREHFTATEVADWVANLPDDASTKRAINPAWRHTYDLELQRAIHFRLSAIEWQLSGGQGEQPEPIRFEWEPEPEGDERPDSMTIDELADWIGDERFAEALGIGR